VIFPINISNSHWTLAVANLKERQFEYYDSLGGQFAYTRYLEMFQRYFAFLWNQLHQEITQINDLSNDFADFGNWPLVNFGKVIQQNGNDCGTFVCKFAECIIQNKELNFSQSDMPEMRRQILTELLHFHG